MDNFFYLDYYTLLLFNYDACGTSMQYKKHIICYVAFHNYTYDLFTFHETSAFMIFLTKSWGLEKNIELWGLLTQYFFQSSTHDQTPPRENQFHEKKLLPLIYLAIYIPFIFFMSYNHDQYSQYFKKINDVKKLQIRWWPCFLISCCVFVKVACR